MIQQQKLNILEKCCILGKSRKNLVNFGENSAKIWQNLRDFGKKQEKNQQFLTEILRLQIGAKECIVQISARAFKRVFTCKNSVRYSRERADLILIDFSSEQLFNFDRALASLRRTSRSGPCGTSGAPRVAGRSRRAAVLGTDRSCSLLPYFKRRRMRLVS